MIIRIYRTVSTFTRSILHANLVAEVEIDEPPQDLQAFADDYDGDFLELDPGDEHEQVRHG